jgi:hypothetical protein
MKSHTGSRLGFDEGPSTAGFTAAVRTLFVIVLPQNQNFIFLSLFCVVSYMYKENVFFGFLSFYVRYSALLHLPPFMQIPLSGGCWDRNKDCCDFGIDSQTL